MSTILRKSKFDRFTYKQYFERFIIPQTEFYQEVMKHVKCALPGSKYVFPYYPTLLDVGAGYGTLARLCVGNNIKVKIDGIEPSNLHNYGKQLATSLSRRFGSGKSHVLYKSFPIGLTDWFEKYLSNPESASGFGEGEYDAITFIRSLHEVMASVGTESFMTTLGYISQIVRPRGYIIFADPQFSDESKLKISKQKAHDGKSNLLACVQKNQMRRIGHCHNPEDYVSISQLENVLLPRNFKLIKKSIMADRTQLDVKEKFGLDGSPIESYVVTFKKE